MARRRMGFQTTVIAKNQTLNHEDVYGHGLLWREIYRMLRKHFVNDKVYDLDENSIIVQSQENVKDYIDNHRKNWYFR